MNPPEVTMQISRQKIAYFNIRNEQILEYTVKELKNLTCDEWMKYLRNRAWWNYTLEKQFKDFYACL